MAPLLAKVRLVLAHPLAAGLFGVPATTFTLSDVLDGGILLARLPKGLLGEDGCRLIGSLLLAALWQAAASRARIPEQRRLDAAIVIDECQNFLHLPIGVDDALAEARGLRTAFWLAHQYRGQLTRSMAAAIDANCRNKVWFTLAPDDADQLARHVAPHLDAGDLARLGGFEAVLRPVAGGRVIAPVTVDTLPPPPPVPGRADQLRATARHHTGLSTRARSQLLAEHLLAPAGPTGRDHPASPHNAEGPDSIAVTQFDDEGDDMDMTDLDVAGLDVSEGFPSSRVGDSRENFQMTSCGQSASAEFPPENPPASGLYAQVDDVEEESWGGTDW